MVVVSSLLLSEVTAQDWLIAILSNFGHGVPGLVTILYTYASSFDGSGMCDASPSRQACSEHHIYGGSTQAFGHQTVQHCSRQS